MKAFENFIANVAQFSLEEMKFLESQLEVREVPKGTAIFEIGDLVNAVYFLEKGILHHFNYNSQGEQKTLSLHVAPCFCTNLESFTTTKRSEESCMTLMDSTVLVLTKSKYDALINSDIKWSNFVKQVTEVSLIQELNESKDRVNKTVKERYLELVQTRPLILQHVSLQVIASYLGTSRETLHRIRKNLRVA